MGRIFRAHQLTLERDVAIKRLEPRDHLPDAEAHFESEARICAILDHPNIVPVHDLGVDGDGHVFYSMKLIEGRPWDEVLHGPAGDGDTAPSKRDDAAAESSGPGISGPAAGAFTDGFGDLLDHLDILLEVVNAVAFAHSRGVIHRDIKPANVMVGRFGQVILVDWGLAVALEPSPGTSGIFDLSRVVVTCGTPAYMPPEIASGRRDDIGPWTDVYMLGATLFEILYRRPPHDCVTALDAIKVAAANDWAFPDPIPPNIRPVHRLLAPVLERALATDPRARHPDAAAFGDDLRRVTRHLDSARLTDQAVTTLARIRAEETEAQRVSVSYVRDRYPKIGRVLASLEQALTSWSDNAAARAAWVEAHLLHTRLSLKAGDLALAKTHLEALRRGDLDRDATTTSAVELDPDHLREIRALEANVEQRIATRRARRRRILTLQVGAVTLTLALLLGSVVALALIRSARDQARIERNHLSRLLIEGSSQKIRGELEGLFEPVRTTLQTIAEWTRSGRLDADDPEVLARFLIPLIDDLAVVSSIVRADDAGGEFMLLRVDDGWQTRLLIPGERARFARLTPEGEVVKTWRREIDYDPHQRPWYRGALEAAQSPPADGRPDIFWTAPYTFFTTQQPGVTASLAVEPTHGTPYVVGLDVSLADITRFVRQMPESDHGRVFVATSDGHLVGLPRTSALAAADSETLPALPEVEALHDPVTTAAWARYELDPASIRRPFRFVVGARAWWAGFERFSLDAGREFTIGVVLPESDFEVPNEAQ